MENFSNINNLFGLEIGKQGTSTQARAFRENSGTEASRRTEMIQKLTMYHELFYLEFYMP